MRKSIVLLTGFLGMMVSGCNKEIDIDTITQSDSKDSTQVETHSLLIIKDGVNYIKYLYTDSTMISYTDFITGQYKEYNYAGDSVIVNTYIENNVLENKDVYH